MDMKYMLDNYDFDTTPLKPYKGYDIDKCRFVDHKGNHKGAPFYLVAESGNDNYCGETYYSLADAKRFIDSVTGRGQ